MIRSLATRYSGKTRFCVGCNAGLPNEWKPRKCAACLPASYYRNAKWRKKQRAAGRCVDCNATAQSFRSRCTQCLDSRNAKQKASIAILKDRVFAAYGGYRCVCCEVSEKVFLTIDHIKGSGSKHRRELGGGGEVFYKWLEQKGFPSGFRVLCFNCNWASAHGGCPHAAH